MYCRLNGFVLCSLLKIWELVKVPAVDGINEFLRDLSYGKSGRTNPIKGAKMPKIAQVDAWDGKDGELPVEEDIDLSDVDLDDHDEL